MDVPSRHTQTDTIVKLDLGAAQQFLEALGATGRNTYQALHDRTKQPGAILHGSLDELRKPLEGYDSGGYGIFVMPNEGDLKGRKKANVIGVRVVFTDADDSLLIDPKTGDPFEAPYPLAPTARVESSLNKHHTYWRVTGCSPEQFEVIQKALAARYSTDPAVSDCSRLMRLPGSVHRKGEPMQVCLRATEPDNIYTLEEFCSAFEIDPNATPKRAAQQRTRVQAATEGVVGIPSRDFTQRLLDGALERLKVTTEGSRNKKVYAVAADLAGFAVAGHIEYETIRARLLEVAEFIGLPREEAEAAITNGLKAGEATPKSPALTDYAPTDYGDAERCYATHGDKVRHSPEGGYRLWEAAEGRWRSDPGETGVKRFTLETARKLAREAVDLQDDDKRRNWLRYALARENAGKLSSTVELLKTIPDVQAHISDFDADPMLLTVANGTLDLKTQTLRPHDPGDLISKRSPVVYDRTATCPRWLEFVHEIANGDAELVAWKQRFYGYTLTGLTTAQIMAVLYGSGSNGKSTELSIIAAVMGEYATTTQFETFAEKKNEGVRNDLAALAGARFVSASEGERGQKLAEGLVKQATGGDPITARFLHREYFEFVPQFKVALATNHKPVIRGTDNGIWRRVRLVPYTRKFEDDEKDENLTAKLRAELPGILNWLLEGCRQWQAKGLGTCAAVQEATAAYRTESDKLADFIASCCVVGEEYSTPTKGLYAAYTEFCEINGEEPYPSRTFWLMLTERGFAADPTAQRINGKSVKVRRGLCLKGEEG